MDGVDVGAFGKFVRVDEVGDVGFELEGDRPAELDDVRVGFARRELL